MARLTMHGLSGGKSKKYLLKEGILQSQSYENVTFNTTAGNGYYLFNGAKNMNFTLFDSDLNKNVFIECSDTSIYGIHINTVFVGGYTVAQFSLRATNEKSSGCLMNNNKNLVINSNPQETTGKVYNIWLE